VAKEINFSPDKEQQIKKALPGRFIPQERLPLL
jgi:hypothetical protein